MRFLAICTALILSSVHTYSQDGRLPDLHLAALQGDVMAIEQHVSAGSDLNARDAYGSTALSIAVTFDHPEVARLLLAGGADRELSDTYGSGPLHLAALFGRDEIADALIEAGADKYALTNNGATPYDIAAAPFERDIALLKGLQAQLGQFGLMLDLKQIKQGRANIGAALQPAARDLEYVDISPPNDSPWPVSDAMEPELGEAIRALIYDAGHYSNIRSIIVLKNGEVLTERYFNGQNPDSLTLVQSVTKSYFASLVGIAIDRGCISSLDATMSEFFPEFDEAFSTTGKNDITIRHLLQMRAGYPWEELDEEAWNRFVKGLGQYAMIGEYPLVSTPGEEFNYSNLSNYILGIIVSKACDVDLREFAIEHLLEPIGSGYGEWYQDTMGYYYSLLAFTPRDVARLGQLYLNDGMHGDQRILPESWCEDSHANYSEDAWVVAKDKDNMGRYLYDLGYGYQWWSADIAGQRIPFAWGHGGQMVFILRDENMVVTAISDPQWMKHNPEAWRAEQSSFNLVGRFLVRILER